MYVIRLSLNFLFFFLRTPVTSQFIFLQEKLGAEILELEASAKEKRYQKKEKEKLLERNKAFARQSADKLREMENIKNKRLQALKSSGAEKIVDAYNWVQAHRHEFRKEVHGPVLIEVLYLHEKKLIVAFRMLNIDIYLLYFLKMVATTHQVNISNQLHAAYLESHVPYYIWKVPNNLFLYFTALTFLTLFSQKFYCFTRNMYL